MKPEAPKLIARLSTLSDLARVRILRLLDQHEMSVGELARALQLPQSTVSRHLKVLHDGDWVVRRSEGTASLYRLVPEALDPQARQLWDLARDQLEPDAILDEDDSRLESVIAERRADSRSFFGRVGGEWDHLRNELFGERFTTEAMLSLLRREWTIADIGCGTGNAAEVLSPLVRWIIAVDREPKMLESARKRLSHLKNVEFRQGDLLKLPLKDGEVDAATVFLVMHHIADPQAAVREVARVLKPGGVLLMVDMVAHNRESYRHTMGHQHLGFQPQQIRQWAKSAGLSDVQCRRLPPETTARGPGLFVATMEKMSR